MGVEAAGKNGITGNSTKREIQETGYSTKGESQENWKFIKLLSGNPGSYITRKPYHKVSGVAVLGIQQNTRCLHGAVLQKSRMAAFVPSLGSQLLDFRNSAKHKI